jgi:hypothetical protein
MLEDFIIDIEIPNHHSNALDHTHVSDIKPKYHLVGWQVLQDDDHIFWILIGPSPLPHASVGWKGDQNSSCIVLQVKTHPYKIDDAFLYAKCQPT